MGWKSVNNFQLEKCDDANHHTGVDCLSGLPDDILVGILSTLPLKEAARTSILSRRWENLWKHTSHLNFDDETALWRIIKNNKTRTGERRKYIEWVNKVIESYKGFALKELRICFDLDESSQNAINHWLVFALARRVERLELDLNSEGDWGRWENVCTLPMDKLRPHQSLFDSLKYLKALSFKSVDVTEQDVEEILRSCPLLENLVIFCSSKIFNLNICGAFALKHLEITLCVYLSSLKVSAPNLISLKVVNIINTLLLENVPKLVDVSVRYTNEEVQLFRAFFCCLSQLEILTLDLHIQKEKMDKYMKCKFPELPKLKKLEILFYGRGDESMIALTCLIRAAPRIQELVINISWCNLLRTRKNVKNEIHSPHQHLKVVKFLGYYGRSSDEELVRYLLDNCVVLETLIIDPRYQTDFPHALMNPDDIEAGGHTKGKPSAEVYPEKFNTLDAVRTSRKYAKKQLQGQVPQHIELVIL